MEGAGLQRVGGLCRTPLGNCKPLLPCADTGSQAIPTRGASGSRLRAPARSRPRLGWAQPAPRAVSWSRAPGVVSGPQMVSQHRPVALKPRWRPDMVKISNILPTLENGSFYKTQTHQVAHGMGDEYRSVSTPKTRIELWSPRYGGCHRHCQVRSHIASYRRSHITAAGSLHRQPLWQSPHRPASRTPPASAGR